MVIYFSFIYNLECTASVNGLFKMYVLHILSSILGAFASPSLPAQHSKKRKDYILGHKAYNDAVKSLQQ